MVRVEIIGNLGRDCAVYETKTGNKFVSFTVAGREFVNGEEKTMWFDCLWFNYNDKMTQSLKKGSGVYVSGALDTALELGKDGRTFVRNTVKVDYVTFNSTGKKGDETQATTVTTAGSPAGSASVSSSKKSAAEPNVPSMYASKAAEKVAANADPIFMPEPENSDDLPF